MWSPGCYSIVLKFQYFWVQYPNCTKIYLALGITHTTWCVSLPHIFVQGNNEEIINWAFETQIHTGKPNGGTQFKSVTPSKSPAMKNNLQFLLQHTVGQTNWSTPLQMMTSTTAWALEQPGVATPIDVTPRTWECQDPKSFCISLP